LVGSHFCIFWIFGLDVSMNKVKYFVIERVVVLKESVSFLEIHLLNI